ncbi:cytochrome P450 [Aspergillus crustosus]
MSSPSWTRTLHPAVFDRQGTDSEQYFHVGLPTGELNSLGIQVVSKLVNGNLATVKALMEGETKKALTREIGRPTKWKRLNAWAVAGKIAQGPGARVIFGQKLADDESFVAAVAQYVSNIAVYGFALRYVSMGPLKDLILYLLHWRHRRSLLAFLTPLNSVIEERKRAQSSRNLSEDEKPFDCIQWAMDQALPEEQKSGEAIARRLVLISTGTIETMAGIMSKQLVDLASHPECHAEIRAEIRDSLAEESQGWNLKATAKMKKLESFIQESLRMSAGATPLTGLRTVTSSDFRLDDNLHLPKGTFIAFPTRCILYDAEIFPEPEKFDAFRFYKIKEENHIAEPKSLRRDIRAGWLQFGYGRQACPGRFYAINVMKTILGEMILRYDIRLAGGKRTRPSTMHIDFDPLLLPDRSVDLEFRARG